MSKKFLKVSNIITVVFYVVIFKKYFPGELHIITVCLDEIKNQNRVTFLSFFKGKRIHSNISATELYDNSKVGMLRIYIFDR